MPKLPWEERCDFKSFSFGIEIEVEWPWRQRYGEYESDRPDRDEIYAEMEKRELSADWAITSDGSLSSGWEFVSPVLHYPQDCKQIESMCIMLKELGAQVKDSCGIHIHVGFPEDANALRRLVQSTATLEDMIYTFSRGDQEEHRGWETFCFPMVRIDRMTYNCSLKELCQPCYSIEELSVKWYGSQKEAEDAKEYKYHSTRYLGLNLHSWWHRGTAEFRYFNSTLNPMIIRSWIVFCLKLCARSVGSQKPLKKIHNPGNYYYACGQNPKVDAWGSLKYVLMQLLGFSEEQVDYFGSYMGKRLCNQMEPWSKLKGMRF